MPITARVRVSGLSASGSAAVSTMVISSVPRWPAGSMLIEPSDLPLVRRLVASEYFTRCTVAVLPSLRTGSERRASLELAVAEHPGGHLVHVELHAERHGKEQRPAGCAPRRETSACAGRKLQQHQTERDVDQRAGDQRSLEAESGSPTCTATSTPAIAPSVFAA